MMRALVCAALLLAAPVAALAAGAPHHASAKRIRIERQSAAEAARAKALAAKARAAARDEAALQLTLASVDVEAAQTRSQAVEAESEAAALDVRRLSESADQAHDQRAFETAIAALLQTRAAEEVRPAYQEDARAVALAALAATDLAARIGQRQQRIDEAARLRAAKDTERASLAATSAALAATRQDQEQQVEQKAREREELLDAAQRAAARAAALGRQAHTLRELAERAEAAPKPGPHGAAETFTGARVSPVAGRVLIAYGTRTKAGPATGVTLATAPGAAVHAPAAGTVVYAARFRSFGQVIILDLGGGVSLVLTGLQTTLAEPGKKVALGEVVGEMPSSSASTAPELYFEVRQAGRTLDPERWLRART